MLLFVLGFLLGLCSLAVLRLVIDLRTAHSEHRTSRFDMAVEAEVNRRYGVGHVHLVDTDDPFKNV